MQVPVRSLTSGEVGTIELDEAVFGLELRPDILQRVVVWQQAKRRAGSHKTKSRSEIRASTRKIYRQKGTGRARHGARSAPIFRGGGHTFAKVPRDHAIDLPKKVRRLGLKIALSSKARDGLLMVLDEARLEEPRTRVLSRLLADLGLDSALIVDADAFEPNFELAARNLPGIQLMRQEGANVYDILRRDRLVLTREAARRLEERLR